MLASGNKKIYDRRELKIKKPMYASKTIDILIQEEQEKFVYILGKIYLYKIKK